MKTEDEIARWLIVCDMAVVSGVRCKFNMH